MKKALLIVMAVLVVGIVATVATQLYFNREEPPVYDTILPEGYEFPVNK